MYWCHCWTSQTDMHEIHWCHCWTSQTESEMYWCHCCRDLYQWDQARQAAIDNFQKHYAEMHNTTAKEVAKDLHLAAQ